jgi:hypothetical protein
MSTCVTNEALVTSQHPLVLLGPAREDRRHVASVQSYIVLTTYPIEWRRRVRESIRVTRSRPDAGRKLSTDRESPCTGESPGSRTRRDKHPIGSWCKQIRLLSTYRFRSREPCQWSDSGHTTPRKTARRRKPTSGILAGQAAYTPGSKKP